MRPTVISWIEGRRSYRSVALRSYWTLGNTFNFWMGISSVGTPSVPIQIICYHVNRFQSITIPSDYNRINEDSTNKMIYYGLLVFFAKIRTETISCTGSNILGEYSIIISEQIRKIWKMGSPGTAKLDP